MDMQGVWTRRQTLAGLGVVLTLGWSAAQAANVTVKDNTGGVSAREAPDRAGL